MNLLKDLKTKLECAFAELGHKPKIRVTKNGLMIGHRFHVYTLGNEELIGFERFDSAGLKLEHHYFNVHIHQIYMIVSTIFSFYHMDENMKFSMTYFDPAFEGDFTRFVKDGLAPSAKKMIDFVRFNTIKQTQRIKDECDESIAVINKACATRYSNSMWWTKCGKL